MTRWTITHRGVPVAAVEASSPEQLGTVAVHALPAFDALRPALPTVWRDANSADAPADTALRPAAVAPRDLELEDETGRAVPTTRLEIVVTGPQSAVAFISLDTAAAHVGAVVRPRPRGAADAMLSSRRDR
jgi:hypothetical protein